MDAVRGRLEQLVILSEKLGRWNYVATGLQTAGLPGGQSLRRASEGVHKLIHELDTGIAKQQHLAMQHMRELRRQRTLHLDMEDCMRLQTSGLLNQRQVCLRPYNKCSKEQQLPGGHRSSRHTKRNSL